MITDPDPWAKWDAVGSVVGGLSAFLGVIFAAVAGVVALRLYKMESERDRKAAEREERAEAYLRRQQAGQVGFWEVDEGTWRLVNHSPLPIYEVLVGTVDYEDQENLQRGKVDFMVGMEIGPFDGVLGPGEQQEFSIGPDQGLSGCVTFIDNAGSTWFRETYRLREHRELDEVTLLSLWDSQIVRHEDD